MKPLVKSVATTAVVLAALAGCASRSSGGSSTSAAGSGNGSAPSSSSNSSPSSTNSSPAGGTSSGAPSSSSPSGGSSSSGGTVKYVPVQGLALEKDGVTLVTEVTWGGCNEQPQLLVTSQDAAKVVVELKTVSHFHTGIMCPNFIRNGEASVKLDAPLGTRQVIDGVKNAAISVG